MCNLCDELEHRIPSYELSTIAEGVLSTAKRLRYTLHRYLTVQACESAWVIAGATPAILAITRRSHVEGASRVPSFSLAESE
jgi:hypothetical protein